MNPAIVCDRSFRNTCCKYIPASPLLSEKEPHDVPGAFSVCELMSVPLQRTGICVCCWCHWTHTQQTGRSLKRVYWSLKGAAALSICYYNAIDMHGFWAADVTNTWRQCIFFFYFYLLLLSFIILHAYLCLYINCCATSLY